MSESKSISLMEQWANCKKKAKEALLFFRLGDFYEAFFDDAKIISQALELTLTQRQNVPMCGVPHHSSESYIDKLLSKGYKVAIAEQMEDPKVKGGLVKREITKILSPATIINSNLIVDKESNFFVSLVQMGSHFGLAAIDLTTSQFKTMELEEQELEDEVFKLSPKEFLIPKNFKKKEILSGLINEKEEELFDFKKGETSLLNHFKTQTLDGFGLRDKKAAIIAAGALFAYLKEELLLDLSNITTMKMEIASNHMTIDYMCMRNLEITESLFYKDKKNTLLSLLDSTFTPMGGRLLCEWVKRPLLSTIEITHRQDAIEELVAKFDLALEIAALLERVKDLERLITKIVNNSSSPKDFAALRFSLEAVPLIKRILSSFSSKLLNEAFLKLLDKYEAALIIEKAIVDYPPFRLSDGNIFKEQYSTELDELKLLSNNSKAWIANYQNRLKEETGIKTLKVGFTNAFGYYIDVSRGQASKTPAFFQRKQTLVNSERFTTDELKEFEYKIITAEERIKALEAKLFFDLKVKIAAYFEEITKAAQAIALIDTLISLAKVARNNNYIRPIVDDSSALIIKEGRHPIVETTVKEGKFIANDTNLDDTKKLMLITGPNMAGKSTYIRQVALIVIMAQMGSFVPAESARIGIVDKLFSRIGASDDISKGQSTFMVEMAETANILNNATAKSLVILDEIGRGTTTFDGISIAWAVAKYLFQKIGAKTLFATHYHELTELENKIGALNYNVTVTERNGTILFSHKIKRGKADKSYGIHVAKLAGLPNEVVQEASKMLNYLEEKALYKQPLFEQLLLFK